MPVVQHPGLIAKCRDRRPEDERPVNVTAQLRWLSEREENRDGNVEDEEQHQEGLGAGKQLAVVVQNAPGAADQERKGKTHKVQRPPGLVPRDSQNAGVQHSVVAE